MANLQEWRAVPELVADLLSRALQVEYAYTKVAAQTGDLFNCCATWNPTKDILRVYKIPTAGPVRFSADKYANIKVAAENEQPNWADEILIKSAKLPVLGHMFEFGHSAFGGPTPLANGIVSALMLGGLGYGAGTLAEKLFPERYVAPGKLRRTLGLMGVGAGAGLAAHNAYVNSRRVPNTGWLRGLVTPNNTDVSATSYAKNARLNSPAQIKESFQQFPAPHTAGNLFAPTVNVPQFNNAAWHDTQRGVYNNNFQQHTPPQFAAAATGLMSGVSAAKQSPIIRPVDVIRGIASAGVGLATANLAGRALSALGGLTPAGQQKLQDMGLWGGMMHAVVPSMFGAR